MIKKILIVIISIFLIVAGGQGLYAQTVNHTHGVFTLFNGVLFLLGIMLIYEKVIKKPQSNK